MNCSICLDDDILEINIHYMECLHYVCDTCFTKLIHNSCPLCRQEISLITKENNYDDSDDDEDLLVDDYIFLIRKNRHENRRKKFQKKKDYLHKIIHNEKNIVIPNDKKRIHKKIKRMLQI